MSEFQQTFYFVVYNSESLFGYDPSNEGWTKFGTVEQVDSETWKVTKRDTAWFKSPEEINPDWLKDIGSPIAKGYYTFDATFLSKIPTWQKELSCIGEFGFRARKEVRTEARNWIKTHYTGLERKNNLTYFNQMC